MLQPEPGQVAFYPVIDAMEEFRLNINAYSPEYGRSNGGTVMVIGKSGGNQFHGSLFEFIRNEESERPQLFRAGRGQTRVSPEPVRPDAGRPHPQKTRPSSSATGRAPDCAQGSPRQSVVPTVAQAGGVFTTTIYDPAHFSAQRLFRTTPFRRAGSIPWPHRCCSITPAPNTPGAINLLPDGRGTGQSWSSSTRAWTTLVTEIHRAVVREFILRDDR